MKKIVLILALLTCMVGKSQTNNTPVPEKEMQIGEHLIFAGNNLMGGVLFPLATTGIGAAMYTQMKDQRVILISAAVGTVLGVICIFNASRHLRQAGYKMRNEKPKQTLETYYKH